MQYHIIFMPKKKFETEGMPDDFTDMERRKLKEWRV